MWKKVLKRILRALLILAVLALVVGIAIAVCNREKIAASLNHAGAWFNEAFSSPTPTSNPTLMPSPTPTSNPTLTPSPTPDPTQVPTQVPTNVPTQVSTVAPTTAPTNVPTQVPTVAPTNVPEVQVLVDSELGKGYYRLNGSWSQLSAYLREKVTAEEAVTAIDCAEYGAAMVVDKDDSRLLPFSAYDLYLKVGAKDVRVNLARNGAKLYAYEEEEGKPFSLHKGAVEATFSGMTDAKAYSTWVCKDHQAVYQGVLLREGYPDAEGRFGAFSTKNGFDPQVLRAVRLCNTEDTRYDWVLVYCKCKAPVVNQKPTGGGNGTTGGNKPSGGNGTTVKPTEPPRFAHEATPAPSGGIAHAPKPTATPTPSGEGGMDRQPTATRPKF